MLRGGCETALPHMVRPTSMVGIFSQNSANAVLLLWHKVKGDGSGGVKGGRRENSGKAMKDEP
jgi:hypothetical protein